MKKLSVIDFEASSLTPYHSYPIQVGCAFDDDVTYGALIRPHASWTDWNAESEKIHGIERERLFDEGEDVRLVAERLNALCDDVMYCDGGIYDIMWADRLFSAACVTRRFTIEHCMHHVIQLNKEYDGYVFAEKKCQAAEELNLKLHDAVNDAIIIQRAIELLIQHTS